MGVSGRGPRRRHQQVQPPPPQGTGEKAGMVGAEGGERKSELEPDHVGHGDQDTHLESERGGQ